MTPNLMLTVSSMLSVLFFTFHMADDIVRGFEPGGFKNLSGVLIIVVWMYGTLMLGGRRAGYVIMILGALLGTLVLVVHLRGAGIVGGRVANTSGIYFFVFTLLALGATSLFSVILSARGLWGLRRGRLSTPTSQT